ncbi:MAG: four helix bundle protein [Clostridia bacterium]|nr:four helix bundle protein [Clostridia bacterium]
MRKAECGVRNEENENIVLNKAKQFALRTIRLYQFLTAEKNEYVMSKQILRSGTSIGANICEAECGQTKADFYAKMNIALKEAAETGYWLELLYESNYIDKSSFESIYADCNELMKLLKAITKTQKSISN